jgi:hypothetical protein
MGAVKEIRHKSHARGESDGFIGAYMREKHGRAFFRRLARDKAQT